MDSPPYAFFQIETSYDFKLVRFMVYDILELRMDTIDSAKPFAMQIVGGDNFLLWFTIFTNMLCILFIVNR
jgi:hypothetical protein